MKNVCDEIFMRTENCTLKNYAQKRDQIETYQNNNNGEIMGGLFFFVFKFSVM